MKTIGIVYTAMLSAALIGTAAVGFAQDDQHGKPEKQDKHAQSEHGQKAQNPQAPKEVERPSPGSHAQAQHAQQNERPQSPKAVSQTSTGNGAHQASQAQQAQQHRQLQSQRASNFDQQHRTWAQRGGYTGYRIPDDRFSHSFGKDHSFRLARMPRSMDGGQFRFQYGGYWMVMMDPFPEYWGAGWDQSDDMYVDFVGGGYYLYDRRYPGRPGVALRISL